MLTPASHTNPGLEADGTASSVQVAPQRDPLCPFPADVIAVEPEAPSVSTFRLEFQDPARREQYRLQPGQFNMIYVPGVGEVPISVSGAPGEGPGIAHTIRFVGRVTHVLASAAPGTVLGLRGPYGRGWPIDRARGRDVLLVAGGLGLAPLRPAVRALLSDRAQFGRLTLLYGARQPSDLLFSREYAEWERLGMEVLITVDRGDAAWRGRVGVVPVLFNRLLIEPARTVVLTCGPEILMRLTVTEAQNRNILDQDIYYSLERNMNCAVGLCGHCQLGPAFICKNGPVFSHQELAPFFRQDML
jgi:NAD(P)H-flavin reductase